MARKSSVISVLITGDSGPLKKALGGAASGLGNLAKVGAAALVGIAGAAAGMASSLIKAAEEGQVAEQRLRNVTDSMGLFGAEATKVSDRLLKFADTLALQTGVSDDLIAGTQGILMTFKEVAGTADDVGGVFDRATKAALDLAAAGFGSAETNAVQLGKALQDPIKGLTALRRSGVTFTEEEQNRIRTLVESNRIGEAQVEILAAIEKQVGGTAAATATSSAKIQVAFDQMKERLGTLLLPAFEGFSAFLINTVIPAIETYLLPVVERIGTVIAEIAPKVTAFADTMMQNLGPAISAVADVFTNTIMPALRDFGTFIMETVVPAIVSLWSWMQENLVPTISTVASFFTQHLLPAAQGLLSFFLDKMVPGLKSIFGPALEGLRTALGFISDAVERNSGTFSTFYETVEPIINFLRDTAAPIIGEVFRIAFELLGGAIGGIIDLFARLLELINDVVGAIRRFADAVASSPVGTALGDIIDAVLGRRYGGIVSAKTPYLVGEAGPELFIPSGTGRIEPDIMSGFDLSGLSREPVATGDRIVINVSGAIDPEGTARTILRVLQDAERRTGARL